MSDFSPSTTGVTIGPDLREGTWAARNHTLLHRTELDCGYRIVVTS
jgi:hypothetical protein